MRTHFYIILYLLLPSLAGATYLGLLLFGFVSTRQTDIVLGLAYTGFCLIWACVGISYFYIVWWLPYKKLVGRLKKLGQGKNVPFKKRILKGYWKTAYDYTMQIGRAHV